jgi:hypothetical protein
MFADFKQNIGDVAVNTLAVAGAGAVGYFGIQLTIWLICKFGLHKETPKRVSRLLGILGGIALALFVAGFLFQGGGGGGWFGMGFGLGGGTGNSSANTSKNDPTSSKTNHESPSASSVPKTNNPLRIRMLGGEKAKVGDELRFYQLESGDEKLTLDKIKPIVRERMQDKPDRPAIKEIVIIIEKDSVAYNHEAVQKLEQFAKDQGLTVTIQRPPSQ